MKKSAHAFTKGFTLVELLVVIAIIAILAAVVVLIINPLELTKRGRDAARLSDLMNLQNAINVAAQEASGSAMDILCSQGGTTCEGRTTGGGTQASDGTGWVKVNLTATKGSVSVPTLPVDPLNPNNAANHYTYCAGSDAWEIDAKLESQQQIGKETTDGGNDPVLYEVGSNLQLIGPTGATPTPVCAY